MESVGTIIIVLLVLAAAIAEFRYINGHVERLTRRMAELDTDVRGAHRYIGNVHESTKEADKAVDDRRAAECNEVRGHANRVAYGVDELAKVLGYEWEHESTTPAHWVKKKGGGK